MTEVGGPEGQDPRQGQGHDHTEGQEDPRPTRQSEKKEPGVETEARAEVAADLDQRKVANQDPEREGSPENVNSQDPGPGRDPAPDPKDEGLHTCIEINEISYI